MDSITFDSNPLFTFTGIAYIPITIILLYLTFRYYRLYHTTQRTLFRYLHYAFGIFSIIGLTGALAGSVFSRSELGISLMLIISSFLLGFANGLLMYIFLKETGLTKRPWLGFTFILLAGLVVFVMTLLTPIHPFIETSGGVNWGMPLHLNIFRSVIYLLGTTPLAALMFLKFKKTGNAQEQKHFLFLSLLLSVILLIVITDFILEPLLHIEALYSEVAIFAGVVAGGVAYFTTYEFSILRVERQFRRLIENINEMIVIVDKDGTIKYVNPVFKKLLDYQPKDLLGHSILDIIHQDDHELIRFNLQQSNIETHTNNIEFRYIQSSQEPLFVESTGNFIPIAQFGRNHHVFVLACHDLSDHKKTELKLIEATINAEEGNRFKTSLISNIYHEIRTPLQSIMGLSELIISKIPEHDDQKEQKELLKQNTDRLLKIVDGLIEISELESRNKAPEARACDYKNEIIIALESFKNEPKITKGDLKLTTSFPDISLPETIQTNPQRLQQIFKNLLSNAIKFSNHGCICLGYEPTPDNKESIKFFVKDQGIGITPENLSLIFLPFRKIDHDALKVYEGAGLGLAITQKLVDLLGGEIWVESQINRGTTFYIKIPIKFPSK